MEFLTATPGHRFLEGQMHHASNIYMSSSCWAQEEPGKTVLILLYLNRQRKGRYQKKKKKKLHNLLEIRFNFLKVHY